MLTDPAFLAPPPPAGLAPGERPQFAVVIAAYEAAGTIGTAVRSVLAQTEPPAELLVVDDESSDDLEGALEPFGEDVRLLRIEHGGAPVAKNSGAAATRAPWIVFLDADDSWAPTRLQRLADLAQARPDLDVLTTDAWFVADGVRTGRFYTAERPFPVRDQPTELLRRNWLLSNVAVRRTAWDAVGGYDSGFARAEDWHCWLRIVLGGATVGCVDEPLLDYVIHDASLSADRSASLLARVDVLDRITASYALTADQYAAARSARRDSLRRGRLARAEMALLDRRSDARGACLDYAAAPSVSLRARAAAVLAAAAPRLAGSWLRRQTAVTGRARSERSVASA